MNKKAIIKSVAVLSTIAVVAVAILAVINVFWRVSDEERFNRAVGALMQADSYEMLYNYDDEESSGYLVIKEFNASYGATNYAINKVRKAVGGKDNGYYLFETTGRGYNSKYVKMLIGYTAKGAITGIKLMDIDTGNNMANKINWDVANTSAKDKTYEDTLGGGSDLQAGSGATKTLNGAAEAINLSNRFFRTIILDVKAASKKLDPSIAADQIKINQLNKLFTTTGSEYYNASPSYQYTQYPIFINAPAVSTYGAGSIDCIYTAEKGDESYVILEVSSSGVAGRGSYGNWTVQIILNADNLAAAINPLTSSDEPFEDRGIDASSLNNAAHLTALFKGKTLAEITAMDKYLQGADLQATTGATQTNNGIKAAVYLAVDKASDAKTALAAFKQEEANNG